MQQPAARLPGTSEIGKANPITYILFCKELTQEYKQRSDEDKFLLESAPHLGFLFTAGERLVFSIRETSQVDLSSMTMVSLEDCLMVEDTRIGSVDVAMR